MTYQECMNQSLTNYGPRTGQRWIGSTYSDLYLCTGSTHSAPSLSSPPSIPDREVTDVTLTVSSSDAFTEVEHYYQCENSDADSVSSDIENSVVASTTGTSVTWQDVPAGAGDAECYRDEPVLYYVRVRSTNTPWSGWQSASGSITASTNPVHLAPSLESASHGSVPYGTETRFTAIATSTEAFDRIEYKSFCYQHSGGSVTSETGRVLPFSPAVLRRIVAWNVTTGDDDGECYSNSGIQFYVRVKSVSTTWSNWVYIWRSVVDPVQHLPPTISGPSLLAIPFGETTRFTATVTSAEAFDELEYRYSCQQLDGLGVTPDAEPLGPFDPAVLRRTVAWNVTTGDDDGECYSNSGIQFYVRVKSDSTTWSNWVYIWRSVVDPVQHLPPTISGPSRSEIPFGETTRFTAAATSAEAFDELEYRYSCQQLDGLGVTPDAEPLGPFDPAVLRRTVAWDVTTGDDNGECHSNSGIQFYVRVKSDSTAWSDDIYVLIPVTAPLTTSTQHLSPSINTPSRLAIPFGETTRFTAIVTSTQVFDRIEYKSFCHQHSGGSVTSETGRVPSFSPAVSSRIVAWNVTTGDDDGECYSNSRIQFYVRVKSDSTTWSNWVYIWRSVIDPVQHPPPTISGPSRSEIPFGETTRFTATAASAEAFDELEYRYSCQQQGGGDVAPDAEPLGPFDPAVTSQTVAWSVTTGDNAGECYSNSGIQFYVRVKSDSTAWSDDIYESMPVTTPTTTTTSTTTTSTTQPPGPLQPHTTPVFGPIPTILNNGTQYPTITVSAGDAFTETEHYYSCRKRNNQRYLSTPVPTPPFHSTNSKDLTWAVATGTGTECDLNISEYVVYVVRVKSATTDWSDWIFETGYIVTPPTAPTGVTANGDSRGVPGTGPQGTGRSRLVWDDVPGSTMYQVQYRTVGGNWEYYETTTNRAIITGLDLDTVYILQVQTFKRDLRSDWSMPFIYTYPTKTPAQRGGHVGPVHILGLHPFPYLQLYTLPARTTGRYPINRWHKRKTIMDRHNSGRGSHLVIYHRNGNSH